MRPVIIETLNHWFHTKIFGWIIPQYSVIYACAFVVVLTIYVIRSSKAGLDRYYGFWSGIWAIAFGIVGGRIYYILQHLTTVVKSFSLLTLTSGTGSIGGYIGGTLGLILFLKIYQAPILKYMDVAASCFGLGIAIGRIGCFISGCCFGSLSDLPWAVRFPPGSLAYNTHLLEGLITSSANASLPVHPIQIYASLNGLLLFLSASYYWPRLKKYYGLTFFLFWLLFCLTRFGLEFLRGDKGHVYIGHFTVTQIICLLLIPTFIIGFYTSLNLRKQKNKHMEERWRKRKVV